MNYKIICMKGFVLKFIFSFSVDFTITFPFRFLFLSLWIFFAGRSLFFFIFSPSVGIESIDPKRFWFLKIAPPGLSSFGFALQGIRFEVLKSVVALV